MLSKSAVSALSRVGKVQQRSFSICGSRMSEVTVIGAGEVKPDMKAHLPVDISQEMKDIYYPHIGNREIVGPGLGVQFDYIDTVDYPMPSVRWANNTPEVEALREKELSDWNTLSLEEKKQLYRNSYRQTFAEFRAPRGDWKRIAAILFYTLFASTLMFLYNVKSYGTLPPTYNKEYQQEMIATMLLKNVGAYTGIASKYDYEKNEWKK